MNSANGTKEELDITTDRLVFGKEPILRDAVSFHLIMYRIKEGIAVNLEDIVTKVEYVCDRCLKKYSQNMRIKNTERIFYSHRPIDIEDEADLYLIDRKKPTIALDECLRQEILLHFPAKKVCSRQCKGLCQVCGKDQNEKQCVHHTKQTKSRNLAFGSLKNFF